MNSSNSPQEVSSAETVVRAAGRWGNLLRAALIVAASFWIYWPVLHGGWLMDDDWYITNNPLMEDPARLWKAWFQPGSWVEYYPIEESVQWLQWQLWHDDTFGYHLTNVILHIFSALLVWRLFSKFGLRLAWLGGLLFAIHPVQVESVAWIVELKNTLSLPAFLLAMCAYLDYAEHGRLKDYFLALGFFLAAMLCKISMALFPVVLLLYAWWKQGRIGGKEIKACVPFLVVSLVLGVTTILAGGWYGQLQMQPAGDAPMGNFVSRLALAGTSISFYFFKCLLPVGLLPIYPKWTVDPPSLSQFLPWPVLGGLVYLLWKKRNGWGRAVVLGGGFFLIMLAPFVGFNWISYMSFTWVMDHFLYIPILGLIGLVVAGLEEIDLRLTSSLRIFGIGGLAAVMGILAVGSHEYAGYFVSQDALWSYTLKRNPEAFLAHNNYGDVLFLEGRLPEAIDQFKEALRLNPQYADAHYDLGNALTKTHDLSGAIAQFEETLRINPNYFNAYTNLGEALRQQGRTSEALKQYEKVLQFKPDDAETRYNIGNLLMQVNDVSGAIAQYEEALRIDPNFIQAHNNLGTALLQTHDAPEAIAQYEEALRLDPTYVAARNNLGNALKQTGQLSEAIEQYARVLQLNPNDAGTRYNLGMTLQQAGRMAEAVEQYGQALSLNPNDAEMHNNVGVALARMNRISSAIAQMQMALKLNPNLVETRKNLVYLQSLQKAPPIKK